MIPKSLPRCYKIESKPHKFCPGCGQAIALKILGFAIDELSIQNKTVFGSDIGCSLLAWDFFDIDTIQTHHGRCTPTMVGFKKAKPEAVVIAFMGDGGGYAIGAQHLVNSCMRNDSITVILINNAVYAMTGGQMAPTTLVAQKTDTTPTGRKLSDLGIPLKGPEMLAAIASQKAYIARGKVTDFFQLKDFYKKAIINQIKNKAFSFVEVLAMCPVNWKMEARESLDFLDNQMAKYYQVGEILVPKVRL